jgi:alpha-L-fucosidase 2
MISTKQAREPVGGHDRFTQAIRGRRKTPMFAAWPFALPLLITLLLSGTTFAGAARLPDTSLNLKLAAPIQTWDEAVPLGNGTMGVLLWGETNTLRLSLDRGDLWDERPAKKHVAVRDRFNWAAMQRMVAEDRMGEFNEVFDSNWNGTSPTKLPAGRVEITLGAGQSIQDFELNLATAEGRLQMQDGNTVRAFVNAANVTEPVALVRIPGAPMAEVRLKSPDAVKQLGYAPAQPGQSDGMRWFEQEAADGFAYAVCVGWKRAGGETLLAVTVSTSNDEQSPVAVAQRRVREALRQGFERPFAAHAAWWARFWETSRVELPEEHILRHYYLVRYFYGAASRRGAPPVPLQGVWTADTGGLPPWKGDYHNDLNTQMTYMGYQGAGHFDEGASFLDMLWDLLPTFRKFARDFYNAPGAAVPGVMSLKGQALGGWGQYSLSPTMGAWNAHLFYLHWRYTGDERFLRTRAYPWCREIGECLMHLLKPDAQGLLKLPLSSSPEIFDNTRRAFLPPNSNYDLMSLKMLFLALAEMASATGDRHDAQRWTSFAQQLGAFHTDADGTLLIAENIPLPGSHRHLSNLIGLYPFNLVTADGGARDRQMIEASLKQWDSLGTFGWCGYSFSWMSALRARVGDPESALRHLDIYARAFILRNGFHANGDQTKAGFSGLTYRPFTLEGNFLAMAAVHEMLLQSWSVTPGSGEAGPIRIFPAMPWRWHDASFEDLRAEGGHRVSARRDNNATTWFSIVVGSGGMLRIRDNFGGAEPKWNRKGAKKVGDNFEIAIKRGETIEGTLPKPKEIPPAPANAAAPVVVSRR